MQVMDTIFALAERDANGSAVVRDTSHCTVAVVR